MNPLTMSLMDTHRAQRYIAHHLVTVTSTTPLSWDPALVLAPAARLPQYTNGFYNNVCSNEIAPLRGVEYLNGLGISVFLALTALLCAPSKFTVLHSAFYFNLAHREGFNY